MQQRDRDRQDLQVARDQARWDVLADHWREERRQAHVEFHSAMNAAYRKLYEIWAAAQSQGHSGPQLLEQMMGPDPDEFLHPVFEGLSRLQLIASEISLDWATEATTWIIRYNNLVVDFTNQDRVISDGAQDTHDAMVREWMSARKAYRAAAREELGTFAGNDRPLVEPDDENDVDEDSSDDDPPQDAP